MERLRSCEQLRREHRLIVDVFAGLDALAERRRSGVDVPVLPVAGAIDFFAGFVAGCHGAKEEHALFPALAASGADDGGLVASLRASDVEADRILGALRPRSTRLRVEDEAWPLLAEYVGLVRGHIASEEERLFPLAEGVLSPEADAALERAFLAVEDWTVGRAGSEALVSLGKAVAHASTALASVKRAARPLHARDVMRPKPATVSPEESLARAAELMTSRGIRELPVVAGSELVGIVTRTDLEPHRGHYEWTAVRTAMTSSPVCVAADTPAGAVARLLLARGFNAVPVTEAGRLVGVVSRADVLSGFTTEGTGG
jgi:CBS domain-containing protein